MSSQSLAREHYSRTDVQREIADFCAGRWVAAHCIGEKGEGELVFRRYFKGKPLAINGVSDFQELLRRLNFKVRTFYASANKYRSFKSVEDLYTPSNVIGCTPTWDVDSTLSNWRETIAVAKEIAAFLESQGLRNSVYVKWSGNGCHVHIHEEAFSENIFGKAHPLDVAFAVVEYVNMKVLPKILESLKVRDIRVENRMDAGRVFTCPLSLHRELDVVCVCMKPNDLESFSPEWIQPNSFRHNTRWRERTMGEADGLALKAYEAVGGYPAFTSVRRRRRRKSFDQQIAEWLQRF
ncbi:MAG: hypothetical protein NZ932_05605 [Candidatus Bathyarchaeota archaeon]|nr:hypothetical protein [Candidatus Bathyarchaeota archaeon]MDW8040677.1 hypothetical protein [Nitrososphaerota archaeon]